MSVARTRLARRKAFHCLHRYGVDSWSEAKNQANFGACFTPHGHGHNYELEAHIEGPVDKETGMIMNLADVDQLLNQLIKPLNGKHLNFEIIQFKEQVPTTENLAQWLFSQLENKIPPPARLVKVRLYEYEDLWVDIWAE